MLRKDYIDPLGYNNWYLVVGKQIVSSVVDELKLNNPSLKEGSIKAYTSQLHSILALSDCITKYEDFFKSPDKIIKSINECDKSMSTKKAYFNLLCSLTRGRALSEDKDNIKCYSQYVYECEDIKRLIEIERLKQKPNGEEVILKDLTMKMLHRALLKHKRDYMSDPTANKDSLMLYIVGLFHIHFTLRNEVPTIIFIGGHFKSVKGRDNYIRVDSRNRKEMVINKNKVRDPASPTHKPRKEKIPKDLNWALNKLLLNRKMGNKLLDIENSGYTKLVKRVWKHKGWELTSSLIRKLYATEVRMEHKGKLEYEIQACEKLDHSMAVHNTDYIIYFD